MAGESLAFWIATGVIYALAPHALWAAGAFAAAFESSLTFVRVLRGPVYDDPRPDEAPIARWLSERRARRTLERENR